MRRCALLISIIIMAHDHDDADGKPSKGLSWVTKPGHVHCMTNTDVSFNWTYTAVDSVNIAWSYKGTADNRELTYILGYNQDSTYIPLGERHSRLDFTFVPGSAVMILRNVTSADDGIYECKVVHLVKTPGGQPPYIEDEVKLSVIADTVLRFTIAIADTKFSLCVADNGTDVSLPSGTVTLPAEMDISVNVDPEAPQPHMIRVQNKIGDHIYNDHSCSQSYTCNELVQFNVNLLTNKLAAADIVVTIEFNIQSLENIHISKTVEFGRALAATFHPSPVVTDTSVYSESSLTTNEAKMFTYRSSAQIAIIVCVPLLILIIAVIVVAMCVRKHKSYNMNKQHQSFAEEGTEEEDTTNFINPRSTEDQINITTGGINKHMICVNLTVAEYTFQFDADPLMCPGSFNESNQGMCELVACLTALLNTSGGVIRLNNTSQSTDMKSWSKKIQKYVTAQSKVIPAQVFRKCVRVNKMEDGACILVAKAQHPVTYKYHTYSRDVTGCREVTDYGTIKRILTQAHGDPNLDISFMTLDHTDKVHVAFWTDISPGALLKEIASLQNMSGGGYIILSDELSKGGTEVKITDKIQKMLTEHAETNESRIPAGTVLKQGKCWTVTQIPISSQRHRHRSKDSEQMCWAMRVKQLSGGAFLQSPECFIINDTGRVDSLKFDMWKRYMVNGTLQRVQTIEGTSRMPAEDETDSAAHESRGPSTQLRILVDLQNETGLSEKPTQVEGHVLATDTITTYNWSSTDTWKDDNSRVSSTALALNIDQDARFSMFEMSKPLRCTPKQNVLQDLLAKQDKAIAVAVDDFCSANTGWLVAFPSILKAFDHNATVAVPTCVLMDLLVADDGKPLKLVTVLSTKCTEETKDYSFAAAMLLKKYVIHEEHANKQQMHVEVACICGDKVIELENPHFQCDLNEFFTWRAVGVGNSVHKSLASVFLTSQTYVKNLLVEEMMFHRMSADQNDLLKKLSKVSHVLIEGPPGTGKSWVAKKYSLGMSEQYRSKSGSKVLYVCPSQTSCDRFTSKGDCTVHLANTWTALKRSADGTWKVVVLDDAHNIPNWTPYQWEGFFEKLRTKHLAIFLDSIIQHKDTQKDVTNLIPSFVKHCMRHAIPYQICKMDKAHRTSNIVASFVKSKWSGSKRIMQEDSFQAVHHIIGDDVHLHILPESQDRRGIELKEFVVDLIDKIFLQRQSLESSYIYEPHNIAVVFDTAKSRKFTNKDVDELILTFRRRKVSYNIHKADKYPAEGVIVDSLENFQGLESKVIIFVIQHEMGYDQLQHLSDSHYITNIASRASRRLDFVYQGHKGDNVRDLLGFGSGDMQSEVVPLDIPTPTPQYLDDHPQYGLYDDPSRRQLTT